MGIGLADRIARAYAGGIDRGRVGRLALLRAAYVRVRLLGTTGGLELRSSCGCRKFVLRPAPGHALAHWQYRLPSPSSSGTAHSELSLARRISIQCAAAVRTPPDAVDQCQLCTHEAMGRGAWADGRVCGSR